MKILYAIQGTGNGHLSRARDIIPLLQQKGELDILVSGTQADVVLPYPIKYRFKGLSFVFGKKGGVDLWETLIRNKLTGMMREIKQLPVDNYDLVINDFEPVSAWACYLRRKPCIALSHQSSVISKNSPIPKQKDRMGQFILKHYAPATAKYGFHFSGFDQNTYTPVIRKQVRDLTVSDEGHYTVYLPAYSDEKLVRVLSRFKDVKWQVFSKHNRLGFSFKNVSVNRIDNEAFLKSMASCTGVLCGAGFETPAEALFLNKRLLVIPMKNQYEQHCNAAALEVLGVPVIRNLKPKNLPVLEKWLVSGNSVKVDFPDITEDIINLILHNHLVSASIGNPVWQDNLESNLA